MGLFRHSRERGADRFVHVRMGCFAVGAVLALVGMANDSRVLVWIAIGVLGVGVVLRLVGNREPGP